MEYLKTRTHIYSALSKMAYPFGMVMPGRSYSNGAYGYGFTGMKKAGDLTNDFYDFGTRVYDGRLCRWLSTDNLKKLYPGYSPYCYVLDNPIQFLDFDGKYVIGTDGQKVTVSGKPPIVSPNCPPQAKLLFESMLKTPEGVESVLFYINHDLEFEFVHSPNFQSSDGDHPHGETIPLDKTGTPITRLSKLKNVSKYKVLFSDVTYNEFDRFYMASKAEILNSVGVHESVHVGPDDLPRDMDHGPGSITIYFELISRIQFHKGFKGSNNKLNLDGKEWLGNYIENQNTKFVKSAYNQAIKGLVKDHQITRKEGRLMKREFKTILNEAKKTAKSISKLLTK